MTRTPQVRRFTKKSVLAHQQLLVNESSSYCGTFEASHALARSSLRSMKDSNSSSWASLGPFGSDAHYRHVAQLFTEVIEEHLFLIFRQRPETDILIEIYHLIEHRPIILLWDYCITTVQILPLPSLGALRPVSHLIYLQGHRFHTISTSRWLIGIFWQFFCCLICLVQ